MQRQLDEDGQGILKGIVDGRLRKGEVLLHSVRVATQTVLRGELVYDLWEETEGRLSPLHLLY